MRPVRHPCFLGTTADHVCLAAAAIQVVSVRAPELFYSNFEVLFEAGHPPLEVELDRAFEWLLTGCAQPGGLWCAYLDPGTGELSRVPRSVLWSVAESVGDPSREWWERPALAHAIADRLEKAVCHPAVDIFVRRSELEAQLADEATLAVAWLGQNLEGVIASVRRSIDTYRAGSGNGFVGTMVEQQLPMLEAVRKVLRAADRESDNGAASEAAGAKITIREAMEPFFATLQRRLIAGAYESRRPERANASLVPVMAADLTALLVGPQGPVCFRDADPARLQPTVKKRLYEVIKANPSAWPGALSSR